MGFNLDKLLLFLLCVVLLASEGEKVCGLRSVDHVLRYGEEGGLAQKNRRILANVHVVSFDAGKKSAAKSSAFDSNSTSKRRVRRGSDPIHNRKLRMPALRHTQRSLTGFEGKSSEPFEHSLHFLVRAVSNSFVLMDRCL
ncbi:hypothetical protein MUK42_12863 [Musa troglodytarum]|nr:hypothetical protein MUK42_12863 [Musa troglodytarum]